MNNNIENIDGKESATNKKTTLLEALRNTELMDRISDIVENIGEFTLDSNMAEGLLRDFPILGSVFSVFHLSKEADNLVKTRKVFLLLNELRLDSPSNSKTANNIIKVKQRLTEDTDTEIERLLFAIKEQDKKDKLPFYVNLFNAYLDGIIGYDQLYLYLKVINELEPKYLLYYLQIRLPEGSVVNYGSYLAAIKNTGLVTESESGLKEAPFDTSFKEIVSPNPEEDGFESVSGSNDFPKQILTPKELVALMSEKKGIFFQEYQVDDAVELLNSQNCYFKITAYRFNYDRRDDKRYICLDFAFLKELYDIDKILHDIILRMTLELEQQLKYKIINMVEKRQSTDAYAGYSFVQSYMNLEGNKNLLDELRTRNNYCDALATRYLAPGANCPIWAFVEMIPFSHLTKLFEHYYTLWKAEPYNNYSKHILRRVNNLRNAAAHNNCLIHNLRHKDSYSLPDVHDRLKKDLAEKIGDESRKNKMKIRFVADFVCLLYAFNDIMPDKEKKTAAKELQNLFHSRMLEHKSWFNGEYKFQLPTAADTKPNPKKEGKSRENYKGNEIITSTYTFLNTVFSTIYSDYLQ